MSDKAFPTIRHLANYVDTQLVQFQQLKTAIDGIIAVSSTLEDRQKQLAECEAAITQAQTRVHEATASHEHMILDMTTQRRDLRETVQKEQQERTKAKEQFETTKAEWQQKLNDVKAQVQEADATLKSRREELSRLQERLKETVDAALSRR